MKLRNIFSLLVVLMLLTLTACEPIEERAELSNNYKLEDIKLEVVQATKGGNKLSIQMNTPGVTGYWDYIVDKKYSDRVEVVFPFTGKHTFTYHITTPYIVNNSPGNREYLQKTVEVQIDQLDEALADTYYKLIGDNLEGKTWVFDKVTTDDKWWYMSSPDNYEELWWNAVADYVFPYDVDGKMVFDLDGGANYTHYESPNAEGVKTSFSFNADFTTITFNNQQILGRDDERVNPSSSYRVIELSEDKMILHTSTNNGGTGWVWVFKPE